MSKSLLFRSSRRYGQRHPWLVGLSVLGVALGVAVVVAIDLAGTSARRAFELSAETVTGTASHHVVGTAGDLREDVYRFLRIELGVRQSAPVIEGYVTAAGRRDRTFQLLGVDPLAEEPFRSYTSGFRGDVDLGTFIARPGGVVLSEGTAAELAVAPGDTLAVTADGLRYPLHVVGLMEPEDEHSARAVENLLVVDVATAQEVLGLEGYLSRIDLLIPSTPEGSALLARIEAALPRDAEVIRSSARTRTVEQMTRAFNLNLRALSLLALVVGMFLIYNTMTFSVVQRRKLVGRLRALGVTRREVFALVVGEAMIVGLIGTAAGLLLGIVLGQGLVQLVTQTINDLYYVVQVRDLAVTPWVLIKSVLLGMGATLLATLPPAREATSAPAGMVLRRSEEESRIRRALPVLAGGGVLFAVLAGVLLLLPGRSLVVSYVALLCLLLSVALLAPGAAAGFSWLIRPLMGRLFGVTGRMAARGVAATLSRTAVAIAALTIAIAATVGIGVMVGSFRETVEVWLSYSLQADVYVQPPSLVFRRGDAVLQPEVVDSLRTAEGVAGMYAVRTLPVNTDQWATDLVAIDVGPRTPETFRFKRGDPGEIWESFQEKDVVIVSEPFSYRYGTRVGDDLVLPTARGERSFTVVGVFYDYGSDLGVVMMSRSTFERYYEDPGVAGLAVYAAPGQDVDMLVQRLRERVGARQDVIVRSNRGLREASLEVFDRTFTVTVVLRLLAVVVAFVGVLSALMALQLERSHELAVLRANGLTPREVWRYVMLQTGLSGLIAGLLSLPLGLALAFVLIHVINKRSFGWTLQVDVAPEILIQAVVLALVAAVLAGWYPARRMARANPALAIRTE